MSKTRIFLSSTCYDLAILREELRDHLIQLGHEPLLSEYPSFPVLPDVTTIENCKKNIRANTDILILVIGGRRGSLDPISERTITNIEYDEARALGIPCFVFVKRSVQSLLNVWKKNPNADFTPEIDYPEVFEFIQRITLENQWMFSFEKVSEVKEIISIQLSNLLQDLLQRQKTNKLAYSDLFSTESKEIQLLARDKPEYWEFLLTGELLKSKLTDVRRRFDRVRLNLAFKPSRRISATEFMDYSQSKMDDLVTIIKALEGQLSVIKTSWGPIGEAGDIVEIKKSIDEFISLCENLVHWEEDLSSVTPPDPMTKLKSLMQGWTGGILDEMERLPLEILKPFINGNKPTGKLEIMLVLKKLNTDEFCAEIKRMSKNPAAFL